MERYTKEQDAAWCSGWNDFVDGSHEFMQSDWPPYVAGWMAAQEVHGHPPSERNSRVRQSSEGTAESPGHGQAIPKSGSL